MKKSLYLLIGAFALFLFFSLSLGLPFNTQPSSINKTIEETKHSRSVLERIRADYEAGRLTVDQYVLYRVWAASNPSRLSDTRYALSPEETRAYGRLLTMIILEAKENWQKLRQETKNQLDWIFLRPTDNNQHPLPQLYDTAHFKIHYTTGTDGGKATDAPDLADVNPANGWPDYVEDFGSYFEYTYNFEVNTLMFNAPPSDADEPNDANNRNPDEKYDVFIYDIPAYGYTDAEQYPNTPSYSYIAVDKNYDWASNPYNQDPDGVKKAAMKVTAAHEFFHAIQFTYDSTEEGWWMETTSTYMEDEVYPDVNDNYQYLPDWFENCDIWGLESTSQLHEYGNFIFAKFLSENFGDSIIKDIWTEMQVTDGLTAIDNVLTSKGSNLVSVFNNFTIANFFLEDMYADGVDYRNVVTGTTKYDGVWLEYQYNEATDVLPLTINSTNVSWDAWMDKWAADYVTISMNGATQSYILTFDGYDNTTRYDVSLVKKAEGVITSQDFTLNAQKDGRMELPYDPDYTNVTLIIRNSGDTATKDPSWRVIIMPKRAHEVTFFTTPTLDSGTITFDGIVYTDNQTGSYNSGVYTATANSSNPNYVFDHWEYSGSPDTGVYVSNTASNPTNVKVEGDGWLKAVFKAIKYTVTVRASGLSYFHRTHVYVDNEDQGQPYLYDYNSRMFTFPIGENHTISVDEYVGSWTPDERYHCPSNSTTVSTDATIVFEYHEEYLVTFEQKDSGGTPHVTVDNVTYTLPSDIWLDAEVEHTFDYESPIAGDAGVRYVISWTYPSSPHKFTYSTTVTGYYDTQYYVTVNSDHGNPTNSTWADEGSYLTILVTSPSETVENQTQWICTGYRIDGGELQQDTSYSFFGVDAPHKIEFFWIQQFWLQLDTGIGDIQLEGAGWYDANSSATISVGTPYQPSPTHQFLFLSWASTGNTTAQIPDPKSTSITLIMDNYYSILAKWQEQWYITVISERGNPTPSQWVNADESLSIHVTSPTDDDGQGTRYICTGYAINEMTTQEGTSYTLNNVQSSHTIKFEWTIQHQLTVTTNPGGLEKQPIASPTGPWYNQGTVVTLTAQSVEGYTFDHWTLDGANQGNGISTITVSMDQPHTATAHYSKQVLVPAQVYLIAAFIVLAVVLIGVIFLIRRRK